MDNRVMVGFENIAADPINYLNSTYYEKWLHARTQGLIEHGSITQEELDAKIDYFRENPAAQPPDKLISLAIGIAPSVLTGKVLEMAGASSSTGIVLAYAQCVQSEGQRALIALAAGSGG